VTPSARPWRQACARLQGLHPSPLPDLARKRRWAKRLPEITRNLGCNPHTARNAIHKFNNEGGLQEALGRGSNRPHTVNRSFDAEGAGSGELNTVITSAVWSPECPFSRPGTVNGADNAEMRFLTVRNTGRACSTAINNDSASPRLTHLTAENAGRTGRPNAVGNINNSNPTMTDVTATSLGFSASAVFNVKSSPTIRQSKLSGSSWALIQTDGGTAKVALSQLVGPVAANFGGTLQCFNNYKENMAAVSCP
jgi:hypothetical protein